ncbi:hypothetical protein ACIBU0_07935 [Streptomyces sp. NPDC049627]|uniref:hypothetical protein n=1 Tax=Streptomyces sp. NPDC049627 TaxID=3365595 RepID=UPI00379DE8B3
MTDGDMKKIVQAMHLWVERHPSPDKPFIQLGFGEALTPRQMADAVADHSNNEAGQLLLRMIEAGAEKYSLEDILHDLAPEGQGDVFDSAGDASK